MSCHEPFVPETAFLATVLCLVGISSLFPLRQARCALSSVGVLILAFGVIRQFGRPGPPGSV